MDLTITELDGGAACLRLQGRLDAPGADAVGTRFTAAIAPKGRNAIVDLSGVSFIASMGLRLLISTARAAHLKGGQMIVFGAPPLVQEVLDDAAIDQIIRIVPTEREALELLRT